VPDLNNNSAAFQQAESTPVIAIKDHALAWAARGFRVFPLRAGTKLPAIKGFYKRATIDVAQIEAWWFENPQYNIGVSAEGLCVIDVDVKNDKDGRPAYAALELPDNVLTVRTPTGGLHYYFRPAVPVANTVDGLARGIDTRGDGGYVIAPGSATDKGAYKLLQDGPLGELPAHIESKITARAKRDFGLLDPIHGDNPVDVARARDWLAGEPGTTKGEGSDAKTVQVFARLKDMGISQGLAFDLVSATGGWNDSCNPPWPLDRLALKAENCYAYFKERLPGCDSVAAHFADTDVSDMPAPEHAAEASCSEEPISFAAFLEREIKPRECLLSPWLKAKSTAMIHAPRGLGKTHLSLSIAYAVATGGKLFNWQALRAARVLLIDAEMPAEEIQNRLKVIHQRSQPCASPDGLDILCDDLTENGLPDLSSAAGQKFYSAKAEGYGLIIVDNLSTICRSGVENDAESWASVQNWLVGQKRAGRSVLLIRLLS
jgi:Bifunctional DNA primase/polymerase, N-terminal/AAA domain